ncbi:unnamed protein product [Albugo candida]|uniref:Uncharacterized protein n=1 Tax=Albugo candida TaxID=65357 RepID=A0A024FTZ7_9STRA|nr:unnamed protein product [Albugo candida]|eukprot:CCI10407.1 unnamed protein product [Albugo candida]
MPVQERSIVDTESLGSSGQSEGSWKVLQGEISGQTHVAYGYGRSQLARHESCECSVSDNSDPYSIDDTTSRILLDAVWGHPIDLQLICQEDEELTKWPTFELEAWSVNKFGLHSFCGHASIPLFIATDQVVYGPIMRLSSHSVRNTLSRLAYLPTSRKHQEELLECMNGNQSNSHAISIEAVGVIYLRYSVLES